MGGAQWRPAYHGHVTSLPLRQLLQSADDELDDNEHVEYACRVTSRNSYGWAAPSEILVFSHKDAFTPAKLTTNSGQSPNTRILVSYVALPYTSLLSFVDQSCL